MKKTVRKKSREADVRQLAALATLLGLMQAASRLSNQLDTLASDIGGSLDEIVETAGIPFMEVYETYRKQPARKKVVKKLRGK